MVIDFHTHIFPRQKAPDVLSKLSDKADIPHYTDGTMHGLLNSMKKAGIQLSLISRITIHPQQVEAVNDWLLGCKRKNILPMATIHPDQPGGDTYIEYLIMDENILKRFFQKHPTERFLFGTDSPFTDQKSERRFLDNLPFLSPSQKEKIAGKNAARLLNI